MNMSMAERLQQAVLKIASQTGTALDLTHKSGKKTVFEELPEGMFQAGERVLVVGALSEQTALSIAKGVGAEGSVLLLEIDSEQMKRSGEHAAGFETQGYANWSFEQGELDDFRTRPQRVAALLAERPVGDLDGYRQLQTDLEKQRLEDPLVASESIDAVVLDTVVNRLPEARVRAALAEAFRVLRRGGRVIVLTLLADESGLPAALPNFPNGLPMVHVPLETEGLTLLDEAGFYGMNYAWRDELPLHVVDGIELRPYGLLAYKGKQGICLDQGHAVIYQGPWREVHDDDGHRYVRGERTAVCEKTYNLLMRAPYQGHLIGVPSYQQVPVDQAPLFDCNTPQLRDPKVTKGKKSVFDQAGSESSCCAPSDEGGGCC